MLMRIAATFMLLLLSFAAAAESVTPSERVTSRLVVRAEATTGSAQVGELALGETAELLERVPRWYRVRLAGGVEGFVSKSWATILPEDGAPLDALAAKQPEELRIHFFNTGAGTCTLVECPGTDARPIVVDCGSFPGSRDGSALSDDDVQARFASILAQYSEGPDVVLSHGDIDHFNLIPHVLAGVTANEIWQGDLATSYNAKLRSWITDQQSRGARLRGGFPANWHNSRQPISDGLQCGDATAFVLTVNGGSSDNARSLVLMLEYLDFTAIFSGDAEGATEAAAIQNFGGNVKATVLTGSHHGARTKRSNSSEWATATAPDVMIYSVGTKYGHPACDATGRFTSTLARTHVHNATCGMGIDNYRNYATQQAEYSTRINGTISVTTSGRSPLHLRCERAPGCDVRIPH